MNVLDLALLVLAIGIGVTTSQTTQRAERLARRYCYHTLNKKSYIYIYVANLPENIA